jgi:hypothetical protein
VCEIQSHSSLARARPFEFEFESRDDDTRGRPRARAMSDDERDEEMTAMELAKRLAPAFAKMAEAAHEASGMLSKFAKIPNESTLVKRGRGMDSEGKRLTKAQKRELKPPRAPTAFNMFMKDEVQRVRVERGDLSPKEVFTECARRWREKKSRTQGSLQGGGSLNPVSTPPAMKDKHKKDKSHKKDKKNKDK